jgi:DNA-directed RNA polymerase specialized sigma24 family protein
MSTTGSMLTESAAHPRAAWPERIIELGAEWKGARGPRELDRILGEMWPLLRAGLSRYLRLHCASRPSVGREDLRDIASEKALEILRKLHAGTWDPTASSAAELCSFVSALARNGLIDHLRIVGRERPRAFETHREWAASPARLPHRAPETGDLVARRSDYVRALSDCASRLHPRGRRIWFLRVFLELSSRQIARHPDVGTTAAVVDVTLARCRAKMRACMRAKGFEPQDMPPGTFASLWEALARPVGPRP